jgi:tetratricopeptide (TPR) repeat protein
MGTHRGWWNGAKSHLAGLLACAGTVGVGMGSAQAAQPTVENLPLAAAYGDGVHAYFAGDFQRAYEDLSQAIEAGTTDPRAYYFRGLAALRQGRSDEAEADFTEGATRESAGLGAWPVGRSLERIQGPDRLRLERHRTRARVTLIQRQRDAELQRYSQIEAAQPDVLRKRRPAGPRLEAGDEANPFEPGAAPERVPAEPAAEPAMPEEPALPGEPLPAPARVPAPAVDPFGDSVPNASKAEQVEELAAEREDVAAQRDQQAEQEAAAGDR